MKIKIPVKFKIGAVSANIRLKRYLTSDEGFEGAFNKRTGQLLIDAGLSGIKRDRVFGHELIEVIKDNYELDLPEKTMSCIANGWLEFLWQLGVEFDWSYIKEEGDK